MQAVFSILHCVVMVIAA